MKIINSFCNKISIFNYFFIFLIIIFFISCSNFNFNSIQPFTTNFSGEWFLNKNLSKKLLIREKDNNSYYLKYNYNSFMWEGVGYQFGEELLVVFKYKTGPHKGYATFNYVSDTTISYKSFSTNGRYRASGIYYKLK